jgi:hypothetical protein
VAAYFADDLRLLRFPGLDMALAEAEAAAAGQADDTSATAGLEQADAG